MVCDAALRPRRDRAGRHVRVLKRMVTEQILAGMGDEKWQEGGRLAELDDGFP
jgi:hypothetical protein